ncbi:hypothetical protein [Reichenbachiella sp. MALMAid0571]
MKQIKTEILIDAAPEKVWSVLTDFENQTKGIHLSNPSQVKRKQAQH